ncbi:hypothetical protein JTB14_008012 [Gonioctena quinquepunctata]|nr:hypothetical protein JTB14_008012 [Gonioctena quinquepunctata]
MVISMIFQKDVHPEAIVNYDETNFTDDPGRIKVIVRKQSKRAEKVMDTSKFSTSVMFSCSASEDIANTPSENQKEKSKEKTKDKPKAKPKRKKVLSSSESDEDILPANLRNKKHLWTTNDDSDDDVETFYDLDNGHIDDEPTDQESVVDETSREILSEEEPIEHDQFNCGDYILVNLKTENGTFREFVAKIVHPQENGYSCTFLRMSEKVKNTYIYPAVEDIGLVEKN